MMFDGDVDKPISIIITTLAAKAYQKQTDITQGLLDVVSRIPQMIESRWDAARGRYIKWVENPVNPEENFADKWPDNHKKEENFYKWLCQVGLDLQRATEHRGMQHIKESLSRPFGEAAITKAFNNLGEQALFERESGQMRMAAGSAALGAAGKSFKQHTNHGKPE